MANWKLYIDDSATHGALLDKNLKAKPITVKGLLPVTAAGGILIRETAEQSIAADLNQLRKKIKRALCLDYLPDLHMRLMWGTTLPRKDGAHPNPYLLATPEQRFKWARQTLHLLSKHHRDGNLHILVASNRIEPFQSYLLGFVFTEDFEIEREVLKRKFGSAAHRYYDIIFNPLSRVLMQILIAAHQFGTDHAVNISAFYDTSDSSKGFSAQELYRDAKSEGYFSRIERLEESDRHQHPLIQLADFVSFTANRNALEDYRVQRDRYHHDAGLAALFQGYTMRHFAPSLKVSRVDLDAQYGQAQALIVHAYAAMHLRRLDPEWCAEHLTDIGEQFASPVARPADPAFNLTVSYALKAEIRLEYLNGKRPLQ